MTAIPSTCIHLLGDLIVTQDGQPIPKLISRKAELLLAYVAQEQRPHSREVLATLLWDERTQQQASANLRTVISSLRKHAGDFVDISRQTVALKAGVWVDTAVFQQQLTEAQKEMPSAAAAAEIEAALALYKGDFLENVSVRGSMALEDWIWLTRASLRQQALEARQYLIAYYLQQGQYDDGIRHATVLLEVDPWHEETHRQMMRLLAYNGQQQAALAQYETCVQLLESELGVPPESETTGLFERLQTAVSTPTNSLPIQTTTFVGREQEIGVCLSHLRDPACRLLTLVGLGGIGKTRLALQIATAAQTTFVDGVYFVHLAAIDCPEALATAVANAINIPFYAVSDVHEQVKNYLHGKEVLLVLDNFEQLLSAAKFVNDWLQQIPTVKFLVTSRVRLDLQGEWLVELSGLPYPKIQTEAEAAVDYAAVQLFIQRARAITANFALTPDNWPSIHRICQIVQGMPLGLELAAAWIRVLSPAQIGQQIEKNLDLLATTARDVPERQRSLTAVFDSVWALLDPQEQEQFAKLSVFRGSFDLNAFLVINEASPWMLAALVERSLLRKQADDRYTMIEALRLYAARQLTQLPDVHNATRVRHSQYFADFLAKQEPILSSREAQTSLAAIATNLDNIHAVWQEAVAETWYAVLDKMVYGLALFYRHRGPYQEGIMLLETAVTRLTPLIETANSPDLAHCRVLSKLLEGWAWLENLSGHFEVSLAASKKAVTWAETAQDKLCLARGYLRWGWNNYRMGNYEASLSQLETAIQLAQELGTHSLHGEGFYGLCCTYMRLGQHNRAEDLAKEGLHHFRAANDYFGEAKIQNIRGNVSWYQGKYQQAYDAYSQSVQQYRAVGNVSGEQSALGNRGLVAVHLGKFDEGRVCFEQCLRVYRELGDKFGEGWILNLLGSLSKEQFRFDHALAYYQQAVDINARVKGKWGELTAVHGIGIVYWLLGAYDQAAVYYERSVAMRQGMGVPHEADLAAVEMSWLRFDQGETRVALRQLRETLADAEARGARPTLAAGLTLLGEILAAVGEYDEATATSERALALWQEMARPHRVIDAQVNLAQIAWEQGNGSQAQLLAEQIMAYLQTKGIDGVIRPFRAYLVVYRILQATEDDRATMLLHDACTRLHALAINISDPTLRCSFLQNVPAHAELQRLNTRQQSVRPNPTPP